MADLLKSREAVISECGRYRYWLGRWFGPGIVGLPILMLNPSTADADFDDPTIRRCEGFARREGYGGICVVNLYAYRATDPAELWSVEDPVGPDNDRQIEMTFQSAHALRLPMICAWGTNAKPARVAAVGFIARRFNVRILCLGTTKDGHPRHPLYLRADTPLVPWPPENGCGNG
jgi:hypothetical protein